MERRVGWGSGSKLGFELVTYCRYITHCFYDLLSATTSEVHYTHGDRQADRQAGRQTDRKADRQAGRQAGRHWQADRQRGRQAGR